MLGPRAPLSPIGLGLILLFGVMAGGSRSGASPAEPDLTARAMGVLNENCIACHSPAKHKGDLVLSSLASATRGGKNGPAVVPGKPDESQLLKLILPGADPHMPPKGQLAPEDIAALNAWVAAGAAWDEAALTNAVAGRDVAPKPLPAGYGPVLALALSHDEKKLAVARGDRVVVIDPGASENPPATQLSIPQEPIYSLAWSDDGKWLACGGYRVVRVWDVQGSKPAGELRGFSGRVNALAFAPGTTTLFAGDGDASVDGHVRQFSIPDGKIVRDWGAHGDAVLGLHVSRDGKVLVTGGGDKLVKVWEWETGTLLATMEGHAAQVTAVAINAEGTRIASTGADRETRVWDLKTREKVAWIPPQTAGAGAVAWLDKSRVLLAGDDGVVRSGNFGDDGSGEGRVDRTFGGASDAVYALALSGDGKTLYGGTHDGRVHAWSTAGAKLEKTLLEAAVGGAAAGEAPISFVNDVLPVLSKAGCNAGACHAKPAGQSGFRLSVFAYDPMADYRAIVKEVRGRRVFPGAPAESLLLKKPTMAVEHGGGPRLKRSSQAYQLIEKWVAQGMPYGRKDEATLARVEVIPKEGRYARRAAQALRVTAHYSDGSTRDVTSLADFSSNEKSVAAVDEVGSVTTGEEAGETVVVARYMGMVDVSRVTVPPDDLLPDSFYAGLPANNYIDRLVYDRLKTLGLAPSESCTDAEFLRRASLDVAGILPTPEQARGFLADTDPHKREKLVDQLLAHPNYADHWANKWADLLRPNPFRVGVKSVYVLDQWLRESFRQNKPYDRLAREVLLARGSTHRDGPAVVLRDRREPADIATLVSQVFLGVRMECARCHHHPNERWSQEDFYQFAAFFGQLGRKGQGISAPISGESEHIWFAPGGTVRHPVSNEAMKPKALDAPAEQLDPKHDPREALAAWVTRPDNAFFARAAANRVWAELMGRGIVHPVDDFRASNPPTNPALLDALAKDFADHGYDLKHLIRTVMRSRAYQRSSVSDARNARDTRNFSRWYRRRPAAEVLLDAVADVTGVRDTLQGAAPDGRAVRAWNYRIDSDFLDAFARPNASADPPCERDPTGSVVQALHLMNSSQLAGKLSGAGGRAAALAASPRAPAEIVTELYLAAYARFPTADELAVATGAFAEPGATRQSATEDVLWALLNSAEFVFNH